MRLSEPRRRALAALRAWDGEHGACRVSNVTDVDAGYVYWQTARWLVDHGLARPSGPDHIALTAAGRDLADRAAGVTDDEADRLR
jgi:hypothetical protein